MSGLPVTIRETTAALADGELSAAEVVDAALQRVDETEPLIAAYTDVDADGALAAAADLDAETGSRGPLHGVPVAVKDIFDVAGMPTRCGSEAYRDATPAATDSTVVGRLRAAGAVVIGKTHTHELACGVYTPPTRNPWDLSRSAGGSSGGSGAAVAAGTVLGATGSDTGGSIRIPAALCGLVGLKPTFGRVSRAGVAVLSWSMDHAGPLARTVEDAALLLGAMAGPDPLDPSTLGQPPLGLSLKAPRGTLGGVRVGVPREPFLEGLQPETAAALDVARDALGELGAEVVDVSIPALEQTLPTSFAIILPEAASYHEARLRAAPELIGDQVRTLLEAGMLLPAAVYLRAQRVRAEITAAVAEALDGERFDALLAPTVPATAQLVEQERFEFSPEGETVGDAFVRTTAPFNLTGLPSIAMPVSLTAAGLPTSVQLAARPFAEAQLIAIARELEAVLSWPAKVEPAGLRRSPADTPAGN